jgi:hypothetical protein
MLQKQRMLKVVMEKCKAALVNMRKTLKGEKLQVPQENKKHVAHRHFYANNARCSLGHKKYLGSFRFFQQKMKTHKMRNITCDKNV